MLYVLYGNDASRQEYKLKKLISKEKPDQITRFHADQDDAQAFFEAVDSGSLFIDKEMIIVDHAAFLTAKNTTGWPLEEVVPRTNTDKIVVLMVDNPKIDTRRKLIKEMAGRAVLMECKKFDEQAQRSFIQDLARERKLQIAPDAFEWFCRYGGMDAAALENAVDRLSLHGGPIDLETVQALVTVSPEDNVFEMTNAFFAKDGLKLLALYRTFRQQNMEPLAINGLLASQIRFIFQVRVLMDAGMNQKQIAAELEATPGRIWNSMKNARRFSSMELLDHLNKLARLDLELKTNPTSKDTLFENFILELAAGRLNL